MVAEAESTQASPDQKPPNPPPPVQETEQNPPPQTEPVEPEDSDYEQDICLSSSQERCTFNFSYADNGPKSSNPMMRQPSSFFKNYQMRMMTDDEQVHTMRIASPKMINLSQQLASVIRNIPKKRIRRLTSNSGATAMGASASGAEAEVTAAAAAAGAKPSATSTPLAEKPPSKSDPQDEDDLEVATM